MSFCQFSPIKNHLFCHDEKPQTIIALRELPELGEDMGVFWWFHPQNTPIYPLYHGDSQRPTIIQK
jgi:hypothetical protein